MESDMSMSEPVGSETISAGIPMPPRVTAIGARDSGVRLELAETVGRWRVGQSPSCDLVIADPYVSNVHCVIERRFDGTVTLQDARSKNGTFVDGAPVIAAELRPGSVIVVGRTYLITLGETRGERAIAQLRGSDPSFRAAMALAMRAARSECSVLILGETGTGKELVARAIHEGSSRDGGPMVAVNCGALPRELIAAELFGHVRGAYTGAVDARDGVFVQAHGGTLFLDELAELPLDLQAHLLRVLETRRVRRLGDNVERSVDVRFVAATNRIDLDSERSPLRFDLYQRLAAVVVKLPPLRHRRGDIPEIAQSFLRQLSARHVLRPAAIDALLHYHWPGNVRELRQAIHRATALSDFEIDVDHLALPGCTLVEPPPAPPGPVPHETVLREVMSYALARRGTIRAAAKEIGMPKSTFAEKARRFGLITPRRRPQEEDE
jgi:transcriptional regulator with PAS, ATPase and Fis domain